MSSEPLNPSKPDNDDKDADQTRVLNIDNLHLHANEIDSLRRLSETDPELARVIVDQKDQFSRRDHASYRFGIISALVMVLGILASLSFILVNLGILLSLVLVLVLFTLALLVRVVMTGEWSDTSAIGHLTKAIIHLFGGKPKD